MTNDSNNYEEAVKTILEEIPEVNSDDVLKEFQRYHTDFGIPPEDAMRSVMRKFQVQTGKEVEKSTTYTARTNKKVKKFKELNSNDKNVEMEVEVVSNIPFRQMVRGEERDLAYGQFKDDPWGESGESESWKYTDWGNQTENLLPGSIVRIEGASVNEYQGKMSLNVNKNTRIIILQKGDENKRKISVTNDPVSIITASGTEGNVSTIGRILSVKATTINKKDGSGSMDIVKGRIADESGAIGFVSWNTFEHKVGDLIKIEQGQIRKFRETPELNIGKYTKVEQYHDGNFPSIGDLGELNTSSISKLRDGARDVNLTAQLQTWEMRKFTAKDGEEKTVWSGELVDPTGRCKVSSWDKLPIEESKLPLILKLNDVRIRAWQGIPDVTIDNSTQVEILDETPWGDAEVGSKFVAVSLPELASGGSRVGVETTASVISVRDDSGIIWRDSETRRVIRENDDTEGMNTVKDLRLRFVIDDGIANCSLILSKAPSEKYLEMEYEQIDELIKSEGKTHFVNRLRSKLIGRSVKVQGRSISDDQGMMFIAENMLEVPPEEWIKPDKIRDKWGLI